MSRRAVAGAGEPDEVGRGLVELERYLADQVPVAGPPGEVGEVDEPVGEGPESARVRRLRAEVAEARALVALQAQDAPLLVDSPKVRRRRLAMVEAARLHALGQDPAALAWRAARWRRNLTCLAMTALVLALGWSTAGVQRFAADGAAAGSPGWWLAWLVEPLISLALLFVVGARAFFASRGQALTDPVLTKIEALFLAITVTMNVWPYLPWVAPEFRFAGLLIHAIGPIVAVSVVTAMPRVWHGFTHLRLAPADAAGPSADRGHGWGYPAPTAGKYRPNTQRGDDEQLARARALIEQGVLPARPSASQLRAALHCGTDTARRLRDALAAGPNSDPPRDAPRTERQ